MTLKEAKMYIKKDEKIKLAELTGLDIGTIGHVVRTENEYSKATPYIIAMAQKKKEMIEKEVETILENPKK